MSSLLIGCGDDRSKRVAFEDDREWSPPLVTLDIDPCCGADVHWDLNDRPLPFEASAFDEIGAYDVLEHVGVQGDWRGYFNEMAEYWRILKPGGLFSILVPIGSDALSDPGHTRFFSLSHFYFLNQEWYEKNKGSTRTDYRWYWKRNFEVAYVANYEGHHFAVILRKA